MKPVEFPEQNYKFVANGCGDLPAWSNGKHIVSCWQLDENDLEAINKSKQIWLVITGGVQPPVDLRVSIPFVNDAEFEETINE